MLLQKKIYTWHHYIEHLGLLSEIWGKVMLFIIIIIGVLPSGRTLAPIPSTPFFSQLFSSSSRTNLPQDHLSFLLLTCLAASSSTFFPPSHPSAVHPL